MSGINAAVAARSRVVPGETDNPTPELDAAVIGDMAAAFLAAFRKGGDAGDADLPALGFTPGQIDRCAPRALTLARRRMQAAATEES